MHPFFTLKAPAAEQLLSTHVTSCSCERDWVLFGNIFGKTELFGLERAKKLYCIRSNSDSWGTGADEEVALSLAFIGLRMNKKRGEG